MNLEVLLAGPVGALAVFLLGVAREWWRNERERRGLLRLLLAEIEHNAEVMRTIGESTRDLLSSPDFLSVQADVWRDVRARTAQLFPEDLADVLNRYYSPLQTLLTLLTFQNRANERANREIRSKYAEMKGMQAPGARNPFDEYLRQTLDAQEAALDGITAYLARSRTDNLLVGVARWPERQQRRQADHPGREG